MWADGRTYIAYQGGDADGTNARQHMAMKAINGLKGLQAAAKERCSMRCNLLVAFR